jgi:hypothetical protein
MAFVAATVAERQRTLERERVAGLRLAASDTRTGAPGRGRRGPAVGGRITTDERPAGADTGGSG